jgi:hypothetical protein
MVKIGKPVERAAAIDCLFFGIMQPLAVNRAALYTLPLAPRAWIVVGSLSWGYALSHFTPGFTLATRSAG